MSANRPRGARVATSREEIEEYERRKGGGPEEPGFLSRLMREKARAVIEDSQKQLSAVVPTPAEYPTHQKALRTLEQLFDQVVNGSGLAADRVAAQVLWRRASGRPVAQPV